MNNWTLKRMLVVSAIISCLSLLLVGGAALLDLKILKEELQESSKATSSVRVQMDPDMMHDAIRADTLAALLAGSRGQTEEILKIRSELKEHANRLLDNLNANKKVFSDAEYLAAVAAVEPVAQRYVDSGLSLVEQSAVAGADAYAGLDAFLKDFNSLEGSLEKLSTLIEQRAQESSANTATDMQRSMWIMGSLIALAFCMIIPLNVWSIRSTTRALQAMTTVMSEVEKTGDLTVRVKIESNNEVGQAMKSFNALMDSIQGIVKDVSQSALVLTETSDALKVSSDKSLQTSEAGSDAASSVAAAVEELSVSISAMAAQANLASGAASESLELSESGKQGIDQTCVVMNDVSTSVKASAEAIKTLEQQAASISQITGVIRGIAEQTNLLALNAAIEAARAGENGRGFAVVADEVRSLAERTSESTEQISGMIEAIQNGTRNAVQAMTEGVQRVDSGVAVTGDVGQRIEQVYSRVSSSSEAIGQITCSLKEQESVGIEIAQNVEKVARISEEGLNVAQETANGARELGELAERLRERVERFRA